MQFPTRREGAFISAALALHPCSLPGDWAVQHILKPQARGSLDSFLTSLYAEPCSSMSPDAGLPPAPFHPDLRHNQPLLTCEPPSHGPSAESERLRASLPRGHCSVASPWPGLSIGVSLSLACASPPAFGAFILYKAGIFLGGKKKALELCPLQITSKQSPSKAPSSWPSPLQPSCQHPPQCQQLATKVVSFRRFLCLLHKENSLHVQLRWVLSPTNHFSLKARKLFGEETGFTSLCTAPSATRPQARPQPQGASLMQSRISSAPLWSAAKQATSPGVP